MLMVIRSDESIHQRETTAFTQYVANECRLSLDQAQNLVKNLLNVPEELLQLTYLARALVDELSAAERQQYFEQLVQIAREDGIQVFEESRTLGLIAKYLYIAPRR